MLLGFWLNRGGVMAWKSGQSYSADLRSRVLAAIDGGMPARAAADAGRLWHTASQAGRAGKRRVAARGKTGRSRDGCRRHGDPCFAMAAITASGGNEHER